ncbi:MAG TPA: sugar ABC transporter permease [Terriglobales bacterium]|nr:sugar ABC transporter permease [Terriglobales bacterium]
MPKRTAAYAFVAPALVAISLFFVLPVAAGFVLSLTDFDIYALADREALRWVGLRNYRRLLDEPRFWQALLNTFYFAAVAGPLSIALSLAAALLLDAGATRWRGLFRTVFFVPVVTTLVAVAVVWRALYHPRYGLLNYGLAAIGLGPIDWLGDPHWAMPAIILMAVWKSFGFNMVIFLAGLQSIPGHLYEAAAIDGARAWHQLRHITVPSLIPTFVFVGIITLIGHLQLFAEPYVMTQGGPSDRTLSMVLLMYEEGFRWWNLGTAAALAFILFAIILVGSAALMLLRRLHEAARA